MSSVGTPHFDRMEVLTVQLYKFRSIIDAIFTSQKRNWLTLTYFYC